MTETNISRRSGKRTNSSCFSKIRSGILSVVLAMVLFLSSFYGAIGTATLFPLNSAFAQGVLSPPEPLVIGQVNSGPPPSSAIFNLPLGYKMEPVLWNLTLPSTVTFDDNGTMYVAESGYSYGEFKPIPRILKVDLKDNRTQVLVDRGLNGPITDIEFKKLTGILYVSHRGIISAVDPAGRIKDLIVGLPSMGIIKMTKLQLVLMDDFTLDRAQ